MGYAGSSDHAYPELPRLTSRLSHMIRAATEGERPFFISGFISGFVFGFIVGIFANCGPYGLEIAPLSP